MRECFKCGKSDIDVKLLDVILDDEIVKICENCVKDESIPIIKRPTTSQLKESERPYTVKERLRRMAGLRGREKEEISKIAKNLTDVTLDDLWKRKKERELEEKFELSKKMNKPLNLIDNFHWHVFMARRNKKLTRKALAELLGESETAIKMIESKELPDESLGLINKLEQFFNIKLKREDEDRDEGIVDDMNIIEEKNQVPEKIEIDLDDAENEPETKEEKIDEEHEKKEPIRVLRFNQNNIKNITISDLQDMKQKKQEKEKLRKQSKMKMSELLMDVEKEKKSKEKEIWEEESKSSLLGKDVEIE